MANTKRALLTSALAIVACVAMLIGSTFAWFTDTASTGVNKIQAGNLKIELQMKDNDGNWVNAEGKTLPFLVEGKIPAEGTQILWEPGCTYFVPQIRVLNKGNLAVKFEYLNDLLGVTGKLAEVLEPRFKAFDANGNEINIDGVNIESEVLKPGEASPAWSFGYHMIEEAGNEYQGATATGVCVTVVATQATYEHDSFDDQYDADAEAVIHVNTDDIQDYLDGKHGSIDGMTLVLAAGEYGQLELGRATAYAGSNTKYYLKNNPSTVDEIRATIAAHPNGGAGVPSYVRSMNDVTLKAADGAAVTVAGLKAFGGQVTNGYDYVVGRSVTNNNNCYYLTHKWNNIAFEGISFTDAVNIEAFQSETVINGIAFRDCAFAANDDSELRRCLRLATGGDCRSNGLTVEKCTFTDGYEGVLTIATTDVTVDGCTFEGLSKNAIDLLVGSSGYGKVTVTNNQIRNMGNGTGVILRLGAVDAKAVLTVKKNKASGELNFKDNYAIKVDSLADGVTCDIANNDWATLSVNKPELAG